MKLISCSLLNLKRSLGINMSTIVHLILFCCVQYVVSFKRGEGYVCVEKDGSHKICHLSYPNPCEFDIHTLKDKICADLCGLRYCHGAPSLDSTSIPEPKIVRTVTYSNRTGGEISSQKCKEVRKTFSEYFIYSEYINRTRCDFYQEAETIAGGEPVFEGEFPHLALIGYKTGTEVDWACGGSLISKQFVLTAAHCLNDNAKGRAKFVRLGITKRTVSIGFQEISISELIFYPEYEATKRYHDIGLIKLSQNAKIGSFVRPACLHAKRNIPYKEAIVAGWGNTRSTSTVGSNDLLKAVLEFFDVQKCNTTFRREIHEKYSTLENGIVDDLMICAGSTNNIRDSCEGDSGGPLQVYYKKPDEIKCMHDIIGIVSTGKLCGVAPNVPGIYTRVSAYVKWIEDIVWPE